MTRNNAGIQEKLSREEEEIKRTFETSSFESKIIMQLQRTSVFCGGSFLYCNREFENRNKLPAAIQP